MALFYMFKNLLKQEESKQLSPLPEERRDGDQNATDATVRQTKTEEDKLALVAQLTPREYMLYLLLLKGYTLKESAKQLGIQYSTANTHMTSIYRKLGVKSRAELIINYQFVNRETTSV